MCLSMRSLISGWFCSCFSDQRRVTAVRSLVSGWWEAQRRTRGRLFLWLWYPRSLSCVCWCWWGFSSTGGIRSSHTRQYVSVCFQITCAWTCFPQLQENMSRSHLTQNQKKRNHVKKCFECFVIIRHILHSCIMCVLFLCLHFLYFLLS